MSKVKRLVHRYQDQRPPAAQQRMIRADIENKRALVQKLRVDLDAITTADDPIAQDAAWESARTRLDAYLRGIPTERQPDSSH